MPLFSTLRPIRDHAELARQVRTLKGELRRALRERALAEHRADVAADLADELETAWREAEQLKIELCDALRDRDQARGLLVDARAKVDELMDDARADAERIGRLESERDEATASAERTAPTRRRLLSAIRMTGRLANEVDPRALELALDASA